jgi:hypothetical protein
MEQRGLLEYFSGEENTGTKTREPPGTIHSSKIHNHQATRGMLTQKETRRKT